MRKEKRIDPPLGTIDLATAEQTQTMLMQAMQDIAAGRVEWFAVAWQNDKATIRASTHGAPKTVRFSK